MAITRKGRNHPEYDEVRLSSSSDITADTEDLCQISEQRKREKFTDEHNFLHVMDAFTSRVDEYSDGGFNLPESIPVPFWMAEAIANGFRHYLANLTDGCRQDLTLDWCFGITADKKDRADYLTITAEKILADAYELMWLFGINREAAIEIAYLLIERKHEGFARFKCTADSVIDMAKRTIANGLLTFTDWQKKTDHVHGPPETLQDDYREFIRACDQIGDVSILDMLDSAIKKRRKV